MYRWTICQAPSRQNKNCRTQKSTILLHHHIKKNSVHELDIQCTNNLAVLTVLCKNYNDVLYRYQ